MPQWRRGFMTAFRDVTVVLKVCPYDTFLKQATHLPKLKVIDIFNASTLKGNVSVLWNNFAFIITLKSTPESYEVNGKLISPNNQQQQCNRLVN
jgi:predicted AAA+ superfamily ATPase